MGRPEEFRPCQIAEGAPGTHGFLPLQPQPLPLTPAARDVLAERQRQITGEGYTVERDDKYTLGELGLAAALYAIPYGAKVAGENLIEQDDHIGLDMALEIGCRWSLKPEPDERKRKVKAAALLLAEIERLDRLEVAKVLRGDGA